VFPRSFTQIAIHSGDRTPDTWETDTKQPLNIQFSRQEYLRVVDVAYHVACFDSSNYDTKSFHADFWQLVRKGFDF
jgi:hypothetical protein